MLRLVNFILLVSSLSCASSRPKYRSAIILPPQQNNFKMIGTPSSTQDTPNFYTNTHATNLANAFYSGDPERLKHKYLLLFISHLTHIFNALFASYLLEYGLDIFDKIPENPGLITMCRIKAEGKPSLSTELLTSH